MNERIKKLWEDATGNCWPRPGKFSAGETEDGLERFVQGILAAADELRATEPDLDQDVDDESEARRRRDDDWLFEQVDGTDI